ESVGNRGAVKVWAVPHELVGKVVFAMDDSVGNAASGVADNVEVESAVEVVIVKLHLLLNEVGNDCVLFGGYREVMGFMPPLDRCKEVSAELLGGRKEGAFAGVLEKVVLWNQSGERNGNMAIGEMGGVCSLKALASALGWLLWFPVSVDPYGGMAGLRALGTGSDRLRMAVAMALVAGGDGAGKEFLDVGSDLLFLGVRDSEGTDPPLDASVGIGFAGLAGAPGKVVCAPWLPLDAASCARAMASCCSSCKILWLDCGSVEAVF
ncbi:unnamed protein product, partial [Symbiodinium sp. KB8]